MERVMGIEPTSKAWEALVLPLNYARESYEMKILVEEKPHYAVGTNLPLSTACAAK